MSDNVKKVGKLTGKTIGFFVFAALFMFNIQLITSGDMTKDINFLGLKFQVGNDVLAARSTDDDDGGGGGSRKTKFYNYGTVTTQKYCQETTWTIAGPQIKTWIATVYWLKEVCDYGGTSHECTYMSQRLTYQGGGC